MTPKSLQAKLRETSGQLRAMCILLAVVFLFGGGARGDIESLALLRPVAILLLFYGLARLNRSHIATNRFVLIIAALSLVLIGLHLIPMPPNMWSLLPGHALVSEIDRAAGLGQIWRPLSLAPDGTLNALFAALVPCAALVLGVQLSTRERHFLLWPVLLFGGLSAAIGLAQISGPINGPLYFYSVTNEGAAVGLFANRNHQALLLAALLPVLAVWATGRGPVSKGSQVRSLMALLAGVAVLLLLLVTGSRAGVLLGAFALSSLPFLMSQSGLHLLRREDERGRPGTKRWTVPVIAAALGFVALLVVLAVWRGRGLAWERLFATVMGEDLRFMILPALLPLIRAYLPFGSGLGSFEQVFQMHEPDALLRPNYANHAHNDWLELALTGGIPALLLMSAAILGFLLRGRTLFISGLVPSADVRLARLGMAVIALAAFASLGDYPLRVPSLACFFVVGVLWMSCPLVKNPSFNFPS